MNSEKRVTIRDIAKAVGVSVATVSMVLNDKGRLPENRRKEIKRIAQTMGYVPNPIARALRGGSTGCIGVVINYFNNPFFRLMFAGLESATEEKGFTFTVSQSHDRLDLEEKYSRMLAERGMDGLIVLPCSAEKEHLLSISKKFGIPIILISHILGNSFASVQADNHYGATLVAKHFLTLGDGRQHIHLAGPQNKSGIIARCEGFCSYLKTKDRSFSEKNHIFYSEELTAEGGFIMMDAILAKLSPPLNIFAVNDEVAMGVLRYCRDHSLCVPKDIAIAGFSDIDILDVYGIPLTTVHVPARRMGENSFELLLDMKNKESAREFPPIVTLPVQLVVRDSTIKTS